MKLTCRHPQTEAVRRCGDLSAVGRDSCWPGRPTLMGRRPLAALIYTFLATPEGLRGTKAVSRRGVSSEKRLCGNRGAVKIAEKLEGLDGDVGRWNGVKGLFTGQVRLRPSRSVIPSRSAVQKSAGAAAVRRFTERRRNFTVLVRHLGWPGNEWIQ